MLKLIESIEIPIDVKISQNTLFHGNIANQPNVPAKGADLFINSKSVFGKIAGIGGAFSELGSKALFSLDDSDREEVTKSLFRDNMNFFRLPVGASDFALDAYSLNDTEDDFKMQYFSITREQKLLIPYVRQAQKYCCDMKIHASPWSPPWWLKSNKSMVSGGSVIDDTKYYKSLAKYYRLHFEAYKEQGIHISRYNIQNEPDVDPGYPSCIMPPKQMAWIIEHVYKEFEEHGIDAEIWAGTFRSVNGASACDFITECPETIHLISGIGCQYTITQQFYDIQKLEPEISIMHTESNCFRGENSWDQAVTLYNSIVDCYTAGCDTYTYWNMILNSCGESSWGWKQNSLISIDEQEKTIKYNPDYYIMSLAAKCVRNDSYRIGYSCAGRRGLATKDKSGNVRFMTSNFSDVEQSGKAVIDGVEHDVDYAPNSISCFELV